MTVPTPQLDRLITRLSSLIGAATGALEANPAAADAWYDEVARQLKRYAMAAYVSGANGAAPARDLIDGIIKAQLEYLAAFRDEIKAAGAWEPRWQSRAQMYADSIKNPWWSGKTRGWALPAMPGDGTTQCLTRCGCAWEIDELAGDGNADAYWRRAKSDSCQTCVEREAQWSPLRIRGGELL
jgi:hypothetical protein